MHQRATQGDSGEVSQILSDGGKQGSWKVPSRASGSLRGGECPGQRRVSTLQVAQEGCVQPGAEGGLLWNVSSGIYLIEDDEMMCLSLSLS